MTQKVVSSSIVKIPFPTYTVLLILHEFCERYAFNGMKALLTLYFKNILNHDEDTSTIFFHTFCILCYLTPVIGGIISDAWLGKFYTILYLSILYTAGNALLTFSAITPIPWNMPQETLSFLALLFVAVGMGGIKPCVNVFGGEQFQLPQQKKQLANFFAMFYFSINTGSLLALFISPILRKKVKCFGMDSCYPLSFGVATTLMIISTAIFVCGMPWYKIKKQKGNVIGKVIGCSIDAIRRRAKLRGEKKVEGCHWLDYARPDKYDSELVEDIKQLFRVMVLFLPLPMFWALYDQQSSRWILQATKMNGDVFGYTFKPDQMPMVNAFLMLPLIVIFSKVIYPLGAKIGFLTTYLERMKMGALFAALAFIVAGIVEIALQKTNIKALSSNESGVSFINTLPCRFNLHSDFSDDGSALLLEAYGKVDLKREVREGQTYEMILSKNDNETSGCESIRDFKFTFTPSYLKVQSYFVTWDKNKSISVIKSHHFDWVEKDGEGDPLIRFAFIGFDKNIEVNNGSFLKIKTASGYYAKLWRMKEFNNDQSNIINNKNNMVVEEVYSIPITELDTIVYKTESFWHTIELHYDNPDISKSNFEQSVLHDSLRHQNDNDTTRTSNSVVVGTVYPKQGGNYLYTIVSSEQEKERLGGDNDNDSPTSSYRLYEHIVSPANSIHMLWLIPQYLLITIAEATFSISGCEFSFAEAPPTMKSLFQAMWFLTVAFGNIIVVFVTELRLFSEQSNEFFLFAALMFLSVAAFAILCSRYERANDRYSTKKTITITEGDLDFPSLTDGSCNKLAEMDVKRIA